MAAVGKDQWDRDICWGKLVVTLASDEQGDSSLMEILVALTYVEYIWSGIGSVGTNHGDGAGAAAAGRDY